jgi:hypothetical protein
MVTPGLLTEFSVAADQDASALSNAGYTPALNLDNVVEMVRGDTDPTGNQCLPIISWVQRGIY